MSSTNRGAERSADDFYGTPAWVTDALIHRIGDLADKRILEPSAGTGAIVERLITVGAVDPELITAIELDPARAARCRAMGVRVIEGDFLAMPWLHSTEDFDVIITNPPFSSAEEHIRRDLEMLAPGGFCAALERLSFGATKERAPFRALHPYDKLELARRPSFFTGEMIGGSAAPQRSLFDDAPKMPKGGETDSADYAWFCFGRWPEGCAVPWRERLGPTCGGRFMVIEDGPKEGRR